MDEKDVKRVDDKEEVKHGLYSATAEIQGGVAIYLDTNGKEVRVTCVDSYGDPKKYGWPDMVYVGVVTKFIRNEGNYPRYEFIYRGGTIVSILM